VSAARGSNERGTPPAAAGAPPRGSNDRETPPGAATRRRDARAVRARLEKTCDRTIYDKESLL